MEDKVTEEQQKMWKKLSTLPKSPSVNSDMEFFRRQLLKGFRIGEMMGIAAGTNVGKSKFRG